MFFVRLQGTPSVAFHCITSMPNAAKDVPYSDLLLTRPRG
jgi:hypothetical protein